MQLTLGQLASLVKGTVVGDNEHPISGVSRIQNAEIGTITFLSNPAYNKYLDTTKADAIIVNKASILKNGKMGIIVANPQLAFSKTLKLFYPKVKHESRIDKTAIISNLANIGKNVFIGSNVSIANGVTIGDDTVIRANTVIGENSSIGRSCELHSNVSIYHDIIIGDNTTIHSGTSIGVDGFGYVTDNNIHKKIPQVGNVVIEQGVEIGSNCSIDRATIGSTVIGEMTKIDNLVHIAHNVKIGKGCLLTAGFAVAGSSEIGDYCTFAGQVGVAPHLKIGNYSTFASKSGVTKSLKGEKVYAGFPARDIKEHNQKEAMINQISRLKKKLDRLIQSKVDN